MTRGGRGRGRGRGRGGAIAREGRCKSESVPFLSRERKIRPIGVWRLQAGCREKRKYSYSAISRRRLDPWRSKKAQSPAEAEE